MKKPQGFLLVFLLNLFFLVFGAFPPLKTILKEQLISNGDNRLVYFNVNIPIVKNNVDIILLNQSYVNDIKELIKIPENFIALGELKGGIDPAGADEHWKTGKMALERIDMGFKKNRCMPRLFFIGAAIEKKMAGEIYDYLKSDFLSNAANLTKPDQITALADWLIHL